MLPFCISLCLHRYSISMHAMVPGLVFGFGREGTIPYLLQRFQDRYTGWNGGRFQLFQDSARDFAQILVANSSRRDAGGLGRRPRHPLWGGGSCLARPLSFPRQHLFSPRNLPGKLNLDQSPQKASSESIHFQLIVGSMAAKRPSHSSSAGLRQQYTRTGGTLSSSSSISGFPSNLRPMSAT